jgi:uncharacterized membrane protein
VSLAISTLAAVFAPSAAMSLPLRALLGVAEGPGLTDDGTENGTVSNAIFVTLTVLIALSVLFETIREKIQHMATETTKPIVDNLWQELTVLGFLSLLSFLAVKSGVLDNIRCVCV